MDKKGKRGPFVRRRDIGLMLLLALLALGTLLPERHWLSYARRIARWRLRRRRSLSDGERNVIRVLVGYRPSGWIETDYLPYWLGHRYLSWLQLLACYPPRGWRPAATLAGADHLDAALARKKGVILWAATFARNDLFTKAALAAAGHRAHLLSRSTHGFSTSRFGRRFLNPIYLHIERRFMGDNIVIDDEGTAGALQKVRERLARNEIVMIYVVPTGRRLVSRSFIGGKINIATGALNLACETGAAVVPAFATTGADGRVVTALTEALPMTMDGDRAVTIERMLDAYVPELEARVQTYPEQFAYPLSSDSGQLLIEPSGPGDDASIVEDQDQRAQSSRHPNPVRAAVRDY